MAWLEPLILAEATTLVLVLALVLIAPVAVKVAGSGAVVATTARKVTALGDRVTAASVGADGHALAPAMSSTAEGRTLGDLVVDGGGGRGSSFGLVLRLSSRRRRARGGKLEAGRRTLLLGDFGRLLGIGNGQGVTSLMAAASTAAPATTTSSIVSSLTLALLVVVKVTKGGTGSPRRGGGRGSHAHVGDSRLITAM
jgi:hypothetical protein